MSTMDPVGRTKFGVLALGVVASALILWLSTSFWLDAWRQHEDARRMRDVAAIENGIAQVTRDVAMERTRTLAMLQRPASREQPRATSAATLDTRLDAALAPVRAMQGQVALTAGLPHSSVALRVRTDAVDRARSALRSADAPASSVVIASSPARHDGIVARLTLLAGLDDALQGLQDELRFEPGTAMQGMRALRRLRKDTRDYAERLLGESTATAILAREATLSGPEGAMAGPAARARSLTADTPLLADALELDIDSGLVSETLAGGIKALLATARPVASDRIESVLDAASTLDAELYALIDGTARASESHARRRLFIDSLLIALCFWIVITTLRLLRNVQQQAWHDRVTGLPNRFRFEQLLDRALRSARADDGPLAVLVLDVDRFKAVNETIGHAAGDALLRSLTDRLSAHLDRSQLLAVLGANEFSVMLPSGTTIESAMRIGERLRSVGRQPFEVDGTTVSVTLSAGVALSDPIDEDARGVCGDSARSGVDRHARIGTAAALLGRAGVALRQAKEDGRNCTLAFDRNLAERTRERVALEHELRSAVGNGELELHYQPKVVTASGLVDGLEALVRWRHPDRGLVSPGLFIPLAERCNLIDGIGTWVLDEAVRQTALWRRDGLDALKIAVNVSAGQFDRPGFVERVHASLDRHGLPAERLELEVTESVAMVDTASVIARLAELRDAGVSIAIDDFGTGYSSLQYLTDLPLDVLKIDRAFIVGLQGDRSLARTIVMMARSLSLETVAEGVETEEQLARVVALGCDRVQGYYYSRPVPADEVPATIARIETSLRTPRERAA